MSGEGAAEIRREGKAGGEATLSLKGRIAIETVLEVRSEILAAVDELEPSRVILDVSEVDYLDSAGALLLFRLEQGRSAVSAPCEIRGASERIRTILDTLHPEALEAEPKPGPSATVLEAVGRSGLHFGRNLSGTMGFAGRMALALMTACRHPLSVQWRTVWQQIGRVGMDALLLVATINFLLGVVIAFMALDQLEKYGGVTILPTVVSMAMIKQFGPLMTSILVAGRSGSAFAAEIATMKINQEIQALRVMGLEPVSFLALPRVIAAVIAVPILSLYGGLAAVIGGMVVGVGEAGLSTLIYIQGVPAQLSPFDLAESLFKATVFGLLLAFIGCQRGFRAEAGPDSVGRSTTSSVVSAISLILLSDAMIGMLVSRLGL